jgi:hypothetical protein
MYNASANVKQMARPEVVESVPMSNPAEFVGFESPIATYPLLVIY